jgi:glycerate-2-kinase
MLGGGFPEDSIRGNGIIGRTGDEIFLTFGLAEVGSLDLRAIALSRDGILGEEIFSIPRDGIFGE